MQIYPYTATDHPSIIMYTHWSVYLSCVPHAILVYSGGTGAGSSSALCSLSKSKGNLRLGGVDRCTEGYSRFGPYAFRDDCPEGDQVLFYPLICILCFYYTSDKTTADIKYANITWLCYFTCRNH